MSAKRVIVGTYPHAGVYVNVAIGINKPVGSSMLTVVVVAALNAFEATTKLVKTQVTSSTNNTSIFWVLKSDLDESTSARKPTNRIRAGIGNSKKALALLKSGA